MGHVGAKPICGLCVRFLPKATARAIERGGDERLLVHCGGFLYFPCPCGARDVALPSQKRYEDLERAAVLQRASH